MRIKFSEVDARTNDIWLASDDTQALKELSNMILPNVEYEVTVKEAKQKRSLNANGYAWSLIQEIAKALGITPIEVYREQIKDLPTYEDCMVKPEAFDKLKKEYEQGHTGRSVERLREWKGYWVIRMWRGSSDFDSLEMSRLIDNLVFEAQQLGIKTEPKANIDKLKASWG